MRRCRGCGSLHFATRPVPFRSVRSAGPVRSVLFCPFIRFRPARPPGVICPASPRCGPDTASDIHTLPSLHLTSFALHRSRSLSCTSGIFQAPGSLSSLLLVFSLVAGLSLPACELHRSGMLPFSSCRPVSAARFRPGSTGGREGRVVGKIGKLSVLSKLLSIFLLGTGAHPPGGADVRRVRDHLSARAKGPCRGRVVAVMTSVIWGRCFSGRSPIHRCIEPLRCR